MKKSNGKWVCDLCGSNQVVGKFWVLMNTGEVDERIDTVETLAKYGMTDFYCKACEEMTTVHFISGPSDGMLGKRAGK